MPIYEYRCLRCGEQLEAIQKHSDRPLKRCPKCSGKLEKLISRTSFHLKGGGWCASGYSKSSPGAKDSSESAASSEGTAKEATTSETPAAKPKPPKRASA